ncbi:MAG: hypothetical protein BGP25_05325 [Lysobacterales bacterium 63-13]|nr:MAG: hypothetical protein BGP25_05325 [Xanthomonadales bacterium 63-13]
MSITITLRDVERHGSIRAAIIATCNEHDLYASGDLGGPTFATSGPGLGWSRQFDAMDYAGRALSDEYGAAGYIDAADGRMATLCDEGEIEWTDQSVVSLDDVTSAEILDADRDTLRNVQDAIDSQVVRPGNGWDDLDAIIEAMEDGEPRA